MKQILFFLFLLAPVLASGQFLSYNLITERATFDATAPASYKSPWQYVRADNKLYRWNYSTSQWVEFTSGAGGGVVDSTRIVQDSIAVYYQSGSEIGRDTIRTSGTGGAGITDGDKGDITVSSSGAVWTIDDGTVEGGTGGIIVDNTIQSIDILDGTITGTDMATGTVTGTQLASSGVTPGAYTNADITVDEDGRIISASSGSGSPTGAAGGSLAGTYPNPTIAASGVTAGVYGSSTTVPRVTIGADGRINSVTAEAISSTGGFDLFQDDFGQQYIIQGVDTVLYDNFPKNRNPNDCLVFIAEGQSNMDGSASKSAFSTEEQALNPNLHVISTSSLDSNLLTPIDPASGNHNNGSISSAGANLPFGTYVDEFFPNNLPVYWVNNGYSGNYIDAFLYSSSDAAGDPTHTWEDRRARITSTIERAAATGCKVHLVHLWMQGEADAQFAATANLYDERLDSLLLDRRELLGNSLHTIAGLITEKNSSTYPYDTTINAALSSRAATDPNFHVFDTNAFPYQSDSTHMTVEGYRLFAKSIIKTMKEQGIEFGTTYEDPALNCSQKVFNLETFPIGAQPECFDNYFGEVVVDTLTVAGTQRKYLHWDTSYNIKGPFAFAYNAFRVSTVPFSSKAHTVEWKMYYDSTATTDQFRIWLKATLGPSQQSPEGYEIRLRNGTAFLIASRADSYIVTSYGAIDTPDGTEFHYRASVTEDDYVTLEKSTDGGSTWSVLFIEQIPLIANSKYRRKRGGSVFFGTNSGDFGTYIRDIKVY